MPGCRPEPCCCKIAYPGFQELLSDLQDANDDYEVYLSSGEELELNNLVDFSISGGWAKGTLTGEGTSTTLWSLCDTVAIETFSD